MIACIDFDGTCVDHRYPDVGPDAPHAVRVLKRMVIDGWRLVLWTMRSQEELTRAVVWFRDHNIPLYGVNRNPDDARWTSSPKASATIYIDDAGIGCPLTNIGGFKRACVDWLEVEKLLYGCTMRDR